MFGASGGMVFGFVCSAGSGSAAMAALLVLAAATSPVIAPAPVRKLRLFVMWRISCRACSSMLGLSGATCAGGKGHGAGAEFP